VHDALVIWPGCRARVLSDEEAVDPRGATIRPGNLAWSFAVRPPYAATSTDRNERDTIMSKERTRQQIRVLLADDHVLVRQGIRQFLEEENDILVVAEAGDGAEALRLIEDQLPDVAILDIRMPQVTGVEATRRIKQQFPLVRVLILTAYDDDPYVFALLQAGADGYVLKTADADELVRAVRAVDAGQSALSPEITAKVIHQMTGGRPAGATAQVEALTERELDVLRLAARGRTNRAIGAELGISHRTVQGHLASIYGKLGANSRTEAVTEALKHGWIVIE
jgi:DNA-binding NarL/FixJ family response regulator